MKYIFYQAFIIFIFTNNLFAINYQLDSLRQVSTKQAGREKLETLDTIILLESNNDILIQDIQMLLSSAKQQSDYIYMSRAYEYLASHHRYIYKQVDSAVVYIDEGLLTLRKVNKKQLEESPDKNIYIKSFAFLNHMRIYTLVKDRNYALALKLVQDLLEDASD